MSAIAVCLVTQYHGEARTRRGNTLANKHGLERDRFVVIAKDRLAGTADHYQFLRMLRFVALSGRYASVRRAAWAKFRESVAKAEAEVERLSVVDFDRIVFESSRREGVWEPDTLFRVFGILLRKEARAALHGAADIYESVAEARRVSALSETMADVLGEERVGRGARRIQILESYDAEEELNQFHLPIELGDIFERDGGDGQYILLVQPCDLMVRGNGKRSYDRKLTRTGALVELVKACDKGRKESWGRLPVWDEGSEHPAWADFARAHQVRLAVLDLCVLRLDGTASIDVEHKCPELLIEPWKARYKLVHKLFTAALGRYERVSSLGADEALTAEVLPKACTTTVGVGPTVEDKTVRYGLKRVMRLRQPWSGALLTAFAQYQARAAFEHAFESAAHAAQQPSDHGVEGAG